MEQKILKEKIYEYVSQMKLGISFVELERHVEGFIGDYNMKINEFNILIWGGVSEEAINSLNELIEENKIEFVSSSQIVYLIDGKCPNLPIVKKSNTKYKNLHWLPTAVSLK